MNGSLVATTLIVTAAAAVRGTWSPCGLSMVSAINPLSERGRGNRYPLTVAWFIAGSVAGGLLLGGCAAVPAWLLRVLPDPAALLVAALGCLVTIAADRRVGGFALPSHPRQVNERWLMQYRRWLYASGFGFQIGTGFATYIMTAATYLLVFLAGLGGSPAFALLTGLVFGLVRGAAVLLSWRCRTPEALRALHRRLDRADPWSLRMVLAGQGLAGVWLAAAGGGWPAALVAGVAVTALVGSGRSQIGRSGSPVRGAGRRPAEHRVTRGRASVP
ncbi:MAG: hypothetical protein ACR2N4_04570 [Jatrophihabitans sp.]